MGHHYPQTTYHNISVPDGSNVNYFTAGNPSNPAVLLLHGFPSSSNQYRNLAPLLASSFFVIAPDYPGFGLTTVPEGYVFTFENITLTIAAFLTALKITSYAVYIFDYGAPVGLRLALKNPDSVKAIISQNGNAYLEGLGDFWKPIEDFWKTNSTEDRESLRGSLLSFAATEGQYTLGFPKQDIPLVDPVSYNYDYLKNLVGKENQDHQLDLFYDYQNNVKLYPRFQEYFRESQVPLLAIWGQADLIFIPPGAEAFKRDLPKAIVEFVDAGHFAIETKYLYIAGQIKKFLKDIKYGG